MQTGALARLVSSFAFLAAAMPANANEVDRDRIENIRVAGIAINDGAEAAFNYLIEAGFKTDVAAYDEWREAGRSFVKGDPGSPSSSPDGYTEIVLQRNGDRLTSISLTYINLRNPFDVEDEHRRVRAALAIPADAPRCGVAGGNASCEAHDPDETATYTLLIMAARQRYETVTLLDVRAVGLE